MKPNNRAQSLHIRLIIYDFDGVMTNNKVFVDENGVECVCVNRGDGYAVSRIKELGIAQVIISTETNKVVAARAKKLGIPVIHGVSDKKSIVSQYCEQESISLKDVLYIGNDLNDYEAMNSVGHRACPSDAEPEIKAISSWSSVCGGGDGVVRELYRYLCESVGEQNA